MSEPSQTQMTYQNCSRCGEPYGRPNYDGDCEDCYNAARQSGSAGSPLRAYCVDGNAHRPLGQRVGLRKTAG